MILCRNQSAASRRTTRLAQGGADGSGIWVGWAGSSNRLCAQAYTLVREAKDKEVAGLACQIGPAHTSALQHADSKKLARKQEVRLSHQLRMIFKEERQREKAGERKGG